MRIGAVLTDLDGTLLEPDGSVTADARVTLGVLRDAGIPVCAVTSKTVAELLGILPDLGLSTPAGFENGAGVLAPDGTTESVAAAVGLRVLEEVAVRIRRETRAPLRTIGELRDEELASLTMLPLAAIAAVRARNATLPLVIPPDWDAVVARALPRDPPLRVLRGNRFLHLQGHHDKGSVVPLLLRAASARPGSTVACGDSPNDIALLRRADLAVVVPSCSGPHPALLAARPDAIVAPRIHGAGWAAALLELLAR